MENRREGAGQVTESEVPEAKQEWLEQELTKESTEHRKDSLDWKRVTW